MYNFDVSKIIVVYVAFELFCERRIEFSLKAKIYKLSLIQYMVGNEFGN